MEGRNDDSARDAQAEEVRYRTLTQMEKVLRVLVDRHGARATVGEMLAIYAAMARLCKQEQVSIAEISEATGLLYCVNFDLHGKMSQFANLWRILGLAAANGFSACRLTR